MFVMKESSRGVFKIPELIEILRDIMINDGSKVEIKSKYYTLSI